MISYFVRSLSALLSLLLIICCASVSSLGVFTNSTDQSALLSIWQGLSLPSQTILSWNFSSGICGQSCVVCDDGKVTSLGQYNVFAGSLATEIGLLTSLTQIIIYSYGTFQLQGTLPTEIGFLSSLEYLYLSNNMFVGTIPTELGMLSSLTTLYLSANQLSGTIPTQLRLPHLYDLSIFSSSLCVSVDYHMWATNTDYFQTPLICGGSSCPSNYGPDCSVCECDGGRMCSSGLAGNGACLSEGQDQPGLVSFYNFLADKGSLTWNTNVNLCGQMGVMCIAGRVVELFLPGLDIQGIIAPELESLTALTSLNLQNNRFSGPFPVWVSQLPKLVNLYLSDNDLTGSIPAALLLPNLLDSVYLSGNSFCYNYTYAFWALASDFSFGLLQCANCPGGVCSKTLSSLFSPRTFSQNFFDQDRQEVYPNAVMASISGYVFVGLFLGFAVLSTAVLVPFRQNLRRPISAMAILLRTPFTFLRVQSPSSHITEIPSFFRGLIGVWVVAALVLITAYQAEVFITQGRVTLSSVQPGYTFSSGQATSSVNSTLSFLVVLYGSGIYCNLAIFTPQVITTGVFAAGTVTSPPPDIAHCVEDSTLSAVNLTYTFPVPLSFTGSSSLTLNLFANAPFSPSSPVPPLFAADLYYELTLQVYDGTTQLSETLSASVSSLEPFQIAVMALAAVPTEQLYDQTTLGTAYTFSHFSSTTANVSAVTGGHTYLNVTFQLPAPDYFYQVRSQESISGLQFIVGVAALASAVLTAGSVFASFGSWLHFRWLDHRGLRKDHEMASLPSLPSFPSTP